MIKVKRFVNQLMSSNCFIVYDVETKRALIIDPGSEKSEREIAFIEGNKLQLDYIILTHEHTDHNWGVNSLKEKYSEVKLVCSEICDILVKKTNRIFFSLYNDDPDYVYIIPHTDVIIKTNDDILEWDGIDIHFVITPGHSKASMCIDINDMLFTGDTIIPFPRYLNKKDGNEGDWKKSVALIYSIYNNNTMIYPGHGDYLALGDWNDNYSNY